MITLRQYEAGEVILHEGEAGETAYVIERGRVDVTKQLDGRPVHLASIGPGNVFGEMSMIDDRPRSATITAIEPTTVRAIHRESFFEGLQSHPEVALHLLKVLFERLREAHSTILQLQQGASQPPSTLVMSHSGVSAPSHTAVFLTGLTPQAAQALPSTPFSVTSFPFRIGRLCRDPLVHNNLMIPDDVPLQVSRHHVALIKDNEHIGVVDRGSTLGALVDGQQIGGAHGDPGPVFFAGSTGSLVLGTRESPFRYKVVIDSETKTKA